MCSRRLKASESPGAGVIGVNLLPGVLAAAISLSTPHPLHPVFIAEGKGGCGLRMQLMEECVLYICKLSLVSSANRQTDTTRYTEDSNRNIKDTPLISHQQPSAPQLLTLSAASPTPKPCPPSPNSSPAGYLADQPCPLPMPACL